jgi:hypothetical protein
MVGAKLDAEFTPVSAPIAPVSQDGEDWLDGGDAVGGSGDESWLD